LIRTAEEIMSDELIRSALRRAQDTDDVLIGSLTISRPSDSTGPAAAGLTVIAT
jgi:hypothetical protein